MKFDSIHSYLQHHLSDKKSVTDAMIVELKKQYRKIYLSNYQKVYSQNKVQINFRVSKKQYQEFQKHSEAQNIKVSTWIKRLVLSNKKITTSKDLQPLKLLLLQTIDLTEEAIEEKTDLSKKELLNILKQMQALL